MTKETIKEIASMAWSDAANAYRMYPNNKHTFGDYWHNAKGFYDKFPTLPTDQQLQDMAMAKFPVEKDEFGEDWNEKDRDKCLQALRDLVKVMGGQDE